MKDPANNVTAELIETPKRRGRPATGKAMTAAERKQRQRKRENTQVKRVKINGENTAIWIVMMADAALIKLAADCMRNGATMTLKAVTAEMIKRSSKNRDSHA